MVIPRKIAYRELGSEIDLASLMVIRNIVC